MIIYQFKSVVNMRTSLKSFTFIRPFPDYPHDRCSRSLNAFGKHCRHSLRNVNLIPVYVSVCVLVVAGSRRPPVVNFPHPPNNPRSFFVRQAKFSLPCPGKFSGTAGYPPVNFPEGIYFQRPSTAPCRAFPARRGINHPLAVIRRSCGLLSGHRGYQTD